MTNGLNKQFGKCTRLGMGMTIKSKDGRGGEMIERGMEEAVEN